MGKDPDSIRKEIERTRAGMEDTIDALAYRTDVKERSKDKARSLIARPKGMFMGIKDNVIGTVQDHAPDRAMVHDATDAIQQAPQQVAERARRVGGVMQDNPIGLAVGGLALGFLAGLVIPSTKLEQDKLGPISDQLKETVKDSGQELMEHGKELAQTAATAAQEAVKDAAPEHAQELGISSEHKVDNLRDVVRTGAPSLN